MGVYSGPDVSESGLVLALDGANYKSFKGEVTANLIPNPTINAYPTTGNAWGTYNTNQYGSGTYFSIGTVSDVTNNIITMTSAHSLRTYDVMNPQTTGGGVTAGINYFIKKISDTSFSLHAYNSSQDGSQGYINPATGTHKVYDSIANDTRVSVNSTNFPTMWYGYAHQPNSGLVKELRYGEFNAIPNLPPNDCIRLHYIRTDDVKDGMAYGVDCTITAGSPVTVSFYTRSANANAVGKQIQYQIYNYSGGNAQGYSWNFTLGQVGVWERQTFTYTPAYGAMVSYWFPVSGGIYAWDWSCMQVEQKSYATNFVPGTRGDTVATGGGWADMSGNGNHGQLFNDVRESSDNLGALVFDGSNDYIDLNTNNIITGTNPFTFEAFYKITNDTVAAELFGNYGAGYTSNTIWISGRYGVYIDVAVPYFQGAPLGLGTYHMAFTRTSAGACTLYKNGVVDGTATSTTSISPGQNFRIGSDVNGIAEVFGGELYSLKVYNRALSAQEIQQNFNATRGRYGV